jgi:hypothetical protein
MIKPVQLLFALTLILFSGCKRQLSDLEFEKNVMTEIFPNLVDSICFDSRAILSPPPLLGKVIYDKDGNYAGRDTTIVTVEQRQKLIEWKKRQIAIENDTAKIIVAFDPVIKRNTTDVEEDFENHFEGEKIFNPKKETDSTYVLDFESIKLKNRIKLKNISEFPKDKHAFWKTKYNFNFSGVVYFSGIQFDQNKKFGILDAGFMCARLFGNGFRIYIKKMNDKWIIDSIEETWIS